MIDYYSNLNKDSVALQIILTKLIHVFSLPAIVRVHL